MFSDKMEYILDFQGFKNGKEFIIKELAIISTDAKIYELHLFLPPYGLHQLTQDVKKQVHWIEKHLHGLYWSYGFREYSTLKDIFRLISIKGKVYVKGLEKQSFISQLLSDFDVKVINMEDLKCPKLSVLKQQTQANFLKPCIFNHSPHNCAYVNVYVLLYWWSMEKHFIPERIKLIDSAIKEWNELGIMMKDEMVRYLPKQFLINNIGNLECIFDKLEPYLQSDPEIVENLLCKNHYHFAVEGFEIDLPVIKRKYCYFCKNGVTFDPHITKAETLEDFTST